MPVPLGPSCNRFIHNEQREFPPATSEFPEILAKIVLAGKSIP